MPKSFGMGNLAGLMSSVGRRPAVHADHLAAGIWLPLHGCSFESTPVVGGIYLLPATVGFLVAGPIAGSLVRQILAPARSRSAGCC